MSDSPHISVATQDNFVQLVIEKSKQVPVLVDFWADWCAPCKNLMPILAKLADEYAGAFHLVKVNTDEQQALAMHFGIRSLPTVKLFKDGQPVDEFMGALPEQGVRQFLDTHIRDEIEVFLEQIDRLVAEGDRQNAEAALGQALQQLPDDSRILLKLAALHLDAGDADAARDLMAKVPADKLETPEAKSIQARFALADRASDSPGEEALRAAIEKNPDDLKARDQLSAVLYARNDFEGSMEQLLEIVKRDRTYEEDSGRVQLIKMFEALGSADPLVQKYRRQLAVSLN
ncbi:MAG: thioredoxin [Proteobacteria bacterium]|nr:MAG: thioredoxin [Pseudomonadota bacterium]